MAKIIAPNEKFSGKRAGVAFVDGKAETDDESAVRYFAKHGYKVEGDIKPPETSAPAPSNSGQQDQATDPLAGLTLEQLREHAATNGIDLGDATRKDDVKAAIVAAQG